MTEHGLERSQHWWARIAGVALLAIIVVGLADQALQAIDGPESNVSAIVAHESRYRFGLTCEFAMLNFDVLLAAALYGLLATVNRPLALLGTLWRCANAFILGVGVVAAVTALDTHGTAIAAAFFDMHDAASPIGLFFWSMGAAVHSWLLWVSNFIPRVLSGAYLTVATVIFVGCLAILISPAIQAVIDPWFVLPDLPVELAVGLWLAIKGAIVRSKASY
jgi:Domain of unknown function (DUF4386)